MNTAMKPAFSRNNSNSVDLRTSLDSRRGPAAPRKFSGSVAAVAKEARSNTCQPAPARPERDAAEHAILFQQFFKSVGTRTYVAQIKKASNENHYLVLTEANRKKDSEEIRKTRIFVYSEDFKAFFGLLNDANSFVQEHPVSPEVARKQSQYWQKRNRQRAGTVGTR